MPTFSVFTRTPFRCSAAWYPPAHVHL